MKCWICSENASGVCRFCGRGVCKDHAKEKPFIFTVYEGPTTTKPKALVETDALWCGTCKPYPEPIEMEEIE
jgi:hypothetical protein